MKKVFLALAVIAISMVSFGQSKSPVTYHVGAAMFMPISESESVDTKTPAFGQTLMVMCQPTGKIGYTVSASYLQNRHGFVQIPVMVGARYSLTNRLSAGLEAGAMFANESVGTKFTYSPSITYRVWKLDVTQRFISSIVGDGNVSSNVGLGVSYKL